MEPRTVSGGGGGSLFLSLLFSLSLFVSRFRVLIFRFCSPSASMRAFRPVARMTLTDVLFLSRACFMTETESTRKRKRGSRTKV
jgi:hypothetical protein